MLKLELKSRGNVFFIIGLFLFANIVLNCCSTEISLVKDGKSDYAIFVSKKAALPEKYAAEQLQHYIREMTGADLPIANQSASPQVVVRVVENIAAHDGFRLRVQNEDVLIEASAPRGCIYGVYAFLEELGCRFYGPEPLGVVIPNTDILTVPASLNMLCEPSFPRRLPPDDGMPEQQVQWGFNSLLTDSEHLDVANTLTKGAIGKMSLEELNAIARRLGLLQHRWGHIWPSLMENQYSANSLPLQKMDYSRHPDWLPANCNGTRQYTGESLCFSNPEALEWFTDNTVNWLLAECKTVDYVNIWSADTWRLARCQCGNCEKRGWNATDWYLLIHNQVYSKAKARGWEGTLGWIVYHGSEEVPATLDLLENGKEMDMLYAPRPRGGSQHGPFTNNHPLSIQYRQNLDSWMDYLDKQRYQGIHTVFEYYYDMCLLGPLAAGRTFLIPQHADMQEDMRFYHQKGFNGFFDCCPPYGAWWPDPLSRRLYHRLLWDVDLDVAAARSEFFERYYGSVADVVRTARETVEKVMFDEPSQQGIEILRALSVPLANAEMEVMTDEKRSLRVKGFRLWVHYCALCKESEYHQKITKNKEKGIETENTINKWLQEKSEFLVANGFMMTNYDLNHLDTFGSAKHLAKFEEMD
ncbi:MAG: DUF4838 domain-containing protein [Bacteroidota bacterium]|nr:DUF4838 domain-containing protein [Bacteroidota bacterium]